MQSRCQKKKILRFIETLWTDDVGILNWNVYFQFYSNHLKQYLTNWFYRWKVSCPWLIYHYWEYDMLCDPMMYIQSWCVAQFSFLGKHGQVRGLIVSVFYFTYPFWIGIDAFLFKNTFYRFYLTSFDKKKFGNTIMQDKFWPSFCKLMSASKQYQQFILSGNHPYT